VSDPALLWAIQTLCLGALLAAAAWSDWRTRRIPNALTLAGAAAAIALHLAAGGGAVLQGLQGFGLALAVGVPLFALGALGGGDVKLLAAVGAFMGPGRFAGAFLVIAVLGGALALLDAARRRALGPLLAGGAGLVRQWLVLGPRGMIRAAPAGSATIPYGIPIALGALAWWLAGGAPA
jgi:prepilin peptidase CpaA